MAHLAVFPQLSPNAIVLPCQMTKLTTWVAIKLVDDQNNPIPGAKYVIIFPDGERKDDVLDGDGYAYFSGIPEGDCTVGFPEFDPFWDLATSLTFSTIADPTLAGYGSGVLGGAGILPQLPPPVSVDIVLLDEADKGVSNEKFQIALPDGDVAQGYLEPDGTARVDGILPGGECRISFPDLDASFVTFQSSR